MTSKWLQGLARTDQEVSGHERLAERIAAQIEAIIMQEARVPGERLPSERGLCQRLKVSRTVLRESIRILEAKGIVKVVPARGLFVGDGGLHGAIGVMSEGLRREAITFGELVEGRRFLETRIGDLAAARRTDAQLEELTQDVDRLAACIDDPEAFLQEDLRFHLDLARATGNRLFEVWLQPILDNLVSTRGAVVLVRPVRERIVVCHRRIAEAIAARDPFLARSAVIAHMDQFTEDTEFVRTMGIG
jgi:GntR family transcriptional repressor for pyruvate dehydrogenase complex